MGLSKSDKVLGYILGGIVLTFPAIFYVRRCMDTGTLNLLHQNDILEKRKEDSEREISEFRADKKRFNDLNYELFGPHGLADLNGDSLIDFFEYGRAVRAMGYENDIFIEGLREFPQYNKDDLERALSFYRNQKDDN
jgi:hypothetical protein